jgi:hypothetical protein
MSTSVALPAGFEDLEPYAAEWALPTREERYATRLAKSFPELEEFYDGVAPKAETAIEYLNRLDLKQLPDDATRLMHLLYSFVLVSYAVNIFHQPRIPDSGAAFFDSVVEPAI